MSNGRRSTPATEGLTAQEFKRRFRSQFADPAFDGLARELEQVAAAAWDGYEQGTKSPRTRKAGAQFADPDYELAIDWIAAREALIAAQALHDDPSSPSQFLLINCSNRNEHTCPGESSKSYRLTQLAHATLEQEPKVRVQLLDLSHDVWRAPQPRPRPRPSASASAIASASRALLGAARRAARSTSALCAKLSAERRYLRAAR